MYRFVYYIDPVLFFQARQTRQTGRPDRQTYTQTRQTRQADKTDGQMDG